MSHLFPRFQCTFSVETDLFLCSGFGALGKTLFESFLGELLALRALGLPRDLASFSEFPNP